MAAVQTARGVKLLIKVGDGGSPEIFSAFCSVNAARSITGDAATNDFNIPDCDDPDLIGWLAREKVSLSYGLSGAGILDTSDLETFVDWFESPDPKNCEIVVDIPSTDGGIQWTGPFHLTHFEITGDRGAKIETTLTMISDGEITHSATVP